MINSLVPSEAIHPVHRDDVHRKKPPESGCIGAAQTQQGAPAPKTLGSFAQQVLDALVPNEESILRLAGMAGNGAAAGTGRVPSEGSGGAAHSPTLSHILACAPAAPHKDSASI